MSTQDSSSDEITFGDLAKGFRSLYHSFLIAMYRLFRFILRNWLVLLILIIVGAALGYWLEARAPEQKKTTLIVQVNYSSAAVIYNAVEQLDRKINNNDREFLKPYHLSKAEKPVLKEIGITPVVDLKDILYQLHTTEEQDKMIQALMKQATKEEGDLLTSSIFVPQYKSHKIELIGTQSADQSTIEGVVSYLNDNEVLQKSKKVYQKSLEAKIHENKLTIAQIDSILHRLGESKSATLRDNQILIAQGDFQNIAQLLREKSRLMDELERWQADRLKYDEPVVLLNKPNWESNPGAFVVGPLSFPIYLVIAFLLLAFIASGLRKGRRLVEDRK